MIRRILFVSAALVAALAAGVGLYGRQVETDVSALTGPSLVTLVSLLVPLVALVLGQDAIVGERDEVAGKIRERCGDFADRVSLIAPFAPDPDLWSDIVADLTSS